MIRAFYLEVAWGDMTLQEGAMKSILSDCVRQSCHVGGVTDETVRFLEIPPLGVRLKSPDKFHGQV
jgi:hypothetical protein